MIKITHESYTYMIYDILSNICRRFRLDHNACILFPCILHIAHTETCISYRMPNTGVFSILDCVHLCIRLTIHNVVRSMYDARQYSRLNMNGMVWCPNEFHVHVHITLICLNFVCSGLTPYHMDWCVDRSIALLFLILLFVHKMKFHLQLHLSLAMPS